MASYLVSFGVHFLRNAFIEVVLKEEEARIEKNLKMAKGHTDDDVVYDEEGRASLKEDDKNNKY